MNVCGYFDGDRLPVFGTFRPSLTCLWRNFSPVRPLSVRFCRAVPMNSSANTTTGVHFRCRCHATPMGSNCPIAPSIWTAYDYCWYDLCSFSHHHYALARSHVGSVRHSALQGNVYPPANCVRFCWARAIWSGIHRAVAWCLGAGHCIRQAIWNCHILAAHCQDPRRIFPIKLKESFNDMFDIHTQMPVACLPLAIARFHLWRALNCSWSISNRPE